MFATEYFAPDHVDVSVIGTIANFIASAGHAAIVAPN
jgi:hypothetical protein